MDNLENVKVGDLLILRRGFGHYSTRLEKVERITKTGLVVTQTGYFNRSGRLRGEQGYERTTAWPASQDDIEGVNRDLCIRELKNFTWEKLSAQKIKAIMAQIKGEEG